MRRRGMGPGAVGWPLRVVASRSPRPLRGRASCQRLPVVEQLCRRPREVDRVLRRRLRQRARAGRPCSPEGSQATGGRVRRRPAAVRRALRRGDALRRQRRGACRRRPEGGRPPGFGGARPPGHVGEVLLRGIPQTRSTRPASGVGGRSPASAGGGVCPAKVGRALALGLGATSHAGGACRRRRRLAKGGRLGVTPSAVGRALRRVPERGGPPRKGLPDGACRRHAPMLRGTGCPRRAGRALRVRLKRLRRPLASSCAWQGLAPAPAGGGRPRRARGFGRASSERTEGRRDKLLQTRPREAGAYIGIHEARTRQGRLRPSLAPRPGRSLRTLGRAGRGRGVTALTAIAAASRRPAPTARPGARLIPPGHAAPASAQPGRAPAPLRARCARRSSPQTGAGRESL